MGYQSWDEFFEKEKSKEYFVNLQEKLREERQNYNVFPDEQNVFRAFNMVKPCDVKVVILGQDPYPTPGNACGLAFSVKEGMALPKSLKNIFKEVSLEYDTPLRTNGDLSDWARQGVFLLNTALTVRSGEPGSHRGLGWEMFTDNAIKYLNNSGQGIVFMLWGNDAKRKTELVTDSRHLVLTAAHPSPLSANRGFFGCNHFILANEFLGADNTISF